MPFRKNWIVKQETKIQRLKNEELILFIGT